MLGTHCWVLKQHALYEVVSSDLGLPGPHVDHGCHCFGGCCGGGVWGWLVGLVV